MNDRLEHALNHAAKLSARRTKNQDRPGTLYIIECHDFVKVGIADKVGVRLSTLQVGCPYELRLLKTFEVRHAMASESRLHAHWKRFEVRGEWFQLPAGELAAAMNADTVEQIFL